MTRVVARLILCLVAMLVAPVIYFVILVILIEAVNIRPWGKAMALTTLITALITTLIWLSLWLGHVRWSAVRLGRTIGVFLAAVAAGAVVGGIVGALTKEEELAWVCAGMVWAICWFAGTTLACRESPAERMRRLRMLGVNAIACPNCGYNLTGLREARCPECGGEFTIDQLVASAIEQRGELD